MDTTTFERELEEKGYIAFTNKGVSMMPLLKQDEDVMVIKAMKDGFKRHDAVLFKRDNGQYIMHRIRKVLKNGYYIIGDNCYSGEFVRKDQMLGILESVVKNGEKISFDTLRYKTYVHTRPLKNKYLWVRHYTLRGLSKVYRKFVRRK